MARLAVIGAGMMGEALARGLIGAGWAPGDLVLTDVRSQRLDDLGSALGVEVGDDNRKAAAEARAVLLAVKPQDAPAVLGDLRDAVTDVVSIVAGLRTDEIERHLGEVGVVRAMPNTPARVGKGATALAPGRYASDELRELASEVFAAVGSLVWVAESHLDTVTALSGSGPAYVFLVAEALVDAAVTLGLARDVAETLAYATIEGAGRMLLETGEHPAVLRGQVTSPGGTTAAGVAVLEGMAVRAAFVEAVRAAQRRSKELGS